jgi:hypothetical protein
MIGERVTPECEQDVVAPPGVVRGGEVQCDQDERTDVLNAGSLDMDVGDDGSMDIIELLQQHRHEVIGLHGMSSCDTATRRQALPYDKMVVLPTAHSAVSELPQNWSKRAQPVHAQNHVEIRQWNDIKVQDEFLGVDDEAHVLAYPVTGHLIVVGYSHSKGWPMDGKKMQMTHDFDG